jgi:hypothetical protein
MSASICSFVVAAVATLAGGGAARVARGFRALRRPDASSDAA